MIRLALLAALVAVGLFQPARAVDGIFSTANDIGYRIVFGSEISDTYQDHGAGARVIIDGPDSAIVWNVAGHRLVFDLLAWEHSEYRTRQGQTRNAAFANESNLDFVEHRLNDAVDFMMRRSWLDSCCPKFDAVCNFMASISDRKYNPGLPLLAVIDQTHSVKKTRLNMYGYPRPALRLADLSGISGHVLGGYKGLPNEDHPKTRYGGHNYSGNEHPSGPFGHLLLGIKILLGPLLFTLGAFCLSNAFIQGIAGKSDTCAMYFFVSLLFIGLGACALVAFLPMLEAFVPPYYGHN